jgi:hypothetical protein
MLHLDWLVWWLLGLIAVAAVGVLLYQFSTDVRMRRRRRKSHSRVISKSRQPTVRFSVRSPKDE